MQTIKFDDIPALTAKIGKEFGPWSEPIHVTQEKINQFADVTGDHQWIHIDIERCKKESPFGGPVAHGFLTLSLLPAFKGTDEYTITGFRNVVNYGANKLRFVVARACRRQRPCAIAADRSRAAADGHDAHARDGDPGRRFAKAGGSLRGLDAVREVVGDPLMAYEQIIYEVADNIATITLNRPEKLNAFTGIMMNEMLDAFDKADADDNVRAVIVTGAGRAFCAGADLSAGPRTFDASREDRPDRKAAIKA